MYVKIKKMRRAIINKSMKTVCGKTITYTQVDGQNPKPHSLDGPAIIYPKEEMRADEYYLHGVKYSKADWQSIVSQYKNVDPIDLPSDY